MSISCPRLSRPELDAAEEMGLVIEEEEEALEEG